MDLLFLCGAYSDFLRKEFFVNSRHGIQYAAETFQNALIDGFLSNNINLSVLSVPFLSTFPFGYKKIYVPNSIFFHDGLNLGESLGFVNLPFFQNPFNKALLFIEKWYKSSKGNKTILVYSLNVFLMKIAIEAKRRYPDLQIAIVILDLKEYMGYNKYLKFLGCQKREIQFINSHIKDFNKFVLLTSSMANRFNLSNDSWTLVEGIYSNKKINSQRNLKGKELKYILYSGSLHKKYGILTLIQAFIGLQRKELYLYVCGEGDAMTEILDAQKSCPNICYLGKLSHEDVMLYQKSAVLLVNPRSSDGEYTKYSFPSKTMEYLASGRPVLMYKLPGIPFEYDQYLHYIEGNTVQDFQRSMNKILDTPSSVLDDISRRGCDFILNEKNSKYQTHKICNLLSI